MSKYCSMPAGRFGNSSPPSSGVVFRRSLFTNGNLQFGEENMGHPMLISEVWVIGRFNNPALVPFLPALVRKGDRQFDSSHGSPNCNSLRDRTVRHYEAGKAGEAC